MYQARNKQTHDIWWHLLVPWTASECSCLVSQTLGSLMVTHTHPLPFIRDLHWWPPKKTALCNTPRALNTCISVSLWQKSFRGNMISFTTIFVFYNVCTAMVLSSLKLSQETNYEAHGPWRERKAIHSTLTFYGVMDNQLKLFLQLKPRYSFFQILKPSSL